jgi:excisionase family DNA binding protein
MTTKRSQPAGAPFDECLMNQTQVPMFPDDHQLFLPSDRLSNASRTDAPRSSAPNLPMTVKDAATFLGVSPQTVYLWVERKQIPHLRVMGRNIRFLRSDLEPFRAQFRQEVASAETT